MEQDEFQSCMWPSGYHSHSCGYCKSEPKGTSKNYYAGSDTQAVHPAHYQELLHKGWRRSGTTWYKADVKHACCPHYSTRVAAYDFKPRKDQRQAVNRFTRYILGQEYIRKAAQLCPRSREEKRRRNTTFDTVEAIHEPEYTHIKRPVDPKTKKAIEPAHQFTVSLEPDSYTPEKYKLFAHYQRTTHKEPPSKISASGFKSFLCSGLAQSTWTSGGVSRPIGSYHQCYRLDGRLVALGVLDLLPDGVSSVYLIYHEDVAHFEFGKLSALHEIALAQERQYGHYYMGYYIHTCTKMRYKRSFAPTYVLDPETFTWDLFTDGLARRMSVRKYVSLSRETQLGLPEPTPAEVAALEATVSSRYQDDDTDDPVRARLFEADMPGAMSREAVMAEVDLADVRVRIQDEVHSLGHLEWDLERGTDSPLLNIAEFIACIGPELARKIVVEIM